MSGKERVSLLVLNDYLKFDRKIYQFMGFSFGRAIKVKTIVYFFLALALELLLFFIPGVSNFLKMLPEVFLLIIPFLIAYLLSDIATEGRSSLHYFRSVLQYLVRKKKQVTYSSGREVTKPKVYQFSETITLHYVEIDPYRKKRAQLVEQVHAKQQLRAQKKLKKQKPVLKASRSVETIEKPVVVPVQKERKPRLTFRVEEGE